MDKNKNETETMYFTDMQLEIGKMKFQVNLFFPADNAETVSDKLNHIADEKSKVN